MFLTYILTTKTVTLSKVRGVSIQWFVFTEQQHTVSITPKYGVDNTLRMTPLATLQSIHITYRVKLDEDSGAFNPIFSLDTLNVLMNKFVTYQLIRYSQEAFTFGVLMNCLRRYPLIFGRKAEACDLHCLHFHLADVRFRDFITKNSCFLLLRGVS